MTDRQKLYAEMRSLLETAESEQRDLTDGEARHFDTLRRRIEAIDLRQGEQDDLDDRPVRRTTPSQPSLPDVPGEPPRRRRGTVSDADASAGWYDVRTGNPVRVLRSDEKFARRQDLLKDEPPNLLGRAIQFLVSGNPNCIRESRAMSEGVNWSGGVAVPEIVADNFIDALRANMAVLRLGAQTVEMPGESVRIVRVATDPTIAVKKENSAFTPTNIGLDGINLIAKTAGAVVESSRELAEDAQNYPALVEQTLARALAQQIDSWAIEGNGGSDGFIGLANHESINDTVVSGSLTYYDDLLDLLALIRADNDEPNGVILSPTNKGTYEKLTSGDATNAAKMYLRVPTPLNEMDWVTTSAIDDTEIVMGNFTRFLLGVRGGVRLEQTTEGGDMFNKHGLAIKITSRVAMNLEHLGSFGRLSAIS